MPIMADFQTDTLHDLIRCERTAAIIYAEAVATLGDRPLASQLRAIQQQHDAAAKTLRRHLDAIGGVSNGTGPRPALTEMLTHAARLLGGRASLSALRHEEEHLARTYRVALDYGDLPAEAQEAVRETFLPRAEANALVLDNLSARIK